MTTVTAKPKNTKNASHKKSFSFAQVQKDLLAIRNDVCGYNEKTTDVQTKEQVISKILSTLKYDNDTKGGNPITSEWLSERFAENELNAHGIYTERSAKFNLDADELDMKHIILVGGLDCEINGSLARIEVVAIEGAKITIEAYQNMVANISMYGASAAMIYVDDMASTSIYVSPESHSANVEVICRGLSNVSVNQYSGNVSVSTCDLSQFQGKVNGDSHLKIAANNACRCLLEYRDYATIIADVNTQAFYTKTLPGFQGKIFTEQGKLL